MRASLLSCEGREPRPNLPNHSFTRLRPVKRARSASSFYPFPARRGDISFNATLMQDEGVKEQMEGEYVLLGEINPDNPDEGPH
jgi:hypothetical protein